MIRNIFVVPRLGQIRTLLSSEAVNGNYIRNIIFIAVCIIAIIVVDLLHENQKSIRTIVCSKPYPIRLAFYLILAFTIIIFGAYGNQYVASNFIYFEF